MRRLRYSVPYIAGKNLPKDSDPAPCGAGLTATQSSSGLRYFNPPAPCGAGQLPALCRYALTYFNPPAPCGAGLGSSCFAWRASNFNPPAPCGAGQQLSAAGFRDRDFNPPAPCGAGPPLPVCIARLDAFQSTRPLRGGTKGSYNDCAIQFISIHPPLAGRDTYLRSIRRACCHFNPPAPCGAGPAFLRDTLSRAHFNPPAPCGAGPA